MSIRHRKIDASNKWRMMEAGSVIMTIIIKKLVAALAEVVGGVRPITRHFTEVRAWWRPRRSAFASA